MFSGWDKSFDCVKTNLTVKAEFEEQDRYYQVIFIDGNGNVIDIQSVVYLGSATEPSVIPRKTRLLIRLIVIMVGVLV